MINHLNISSYSLHPYQFGFSVNHSTETANRYVVDKVKSQLDWGEVVGAVFLSLKKEFVTINHGVLLSKLKTFNFDSGTIINGLNLIYHTRIVRVRNHQSGVISLSVGIPQGSILGPLLFYLYVNDLPNVCPNVKTQMYADDSNLCTC